MCRRNGRFPYRECEWAIYMAGYWDMNGNVVGYNQAYYFECVSENGFALPSGTMMIHHWVLGVAIFIPSKGCLGVS